MCICRPSHSLISGAIVPESSCSLLVLQADLHAEEMGNNVSASVSLLGDLKAVVIQVDSVLTL